MSNHSESRGSRDSLAAWFGGRVVSQGCDQLEGVEDHCRARLCSSWQEAPMFHSVAMGFLLESHRTEIKEKKEGEREEEEENVNINNKLQKMLCCL